MFNNRKDYIERPSPSLYINFPFFGMEVRWRDLEVHDTTGFRGLTSSTVVKGFCDDGCFNENGYCHPILKARAAAHCCIALW